MRCLCPLVVSLFLASGCADERAEKQAVQADPALALYQKGDGMLTCDQIDTGVTKMNARITLAQRMTDQEVNNRRRLDKPNTDARVLSETAEGLVPLPGLGTGGTMATTGDGAGSNGVLVIQKGTAEAAIARANELVRIGKVRKCYA